MGDREKEGGHVYIDGSGGGEVWLERRRIRRSLFCCTVFQDLSLVFRFLNCKAASVVLLVLYFIHIYLCSDKSLRTV